MCICVFVNVSERLRFSYLAVNYLNEIIIQ